LDICNGTKLYSTQRWSVSGTSPVCSGSTGITYTYNDGSPDTYNGGLRDHNDDSPIADAWSWTVPEGATITGGNGTATITVDWGIAITGDVTCTPVPVVV